MFLSGTDELCTGRPKAVDMERADLVDRLVDPGREGFVFPRYEDYCFANVPETALSVLCDSFEQRLPSDVFDGVDTDVSSVVVVVLDGLGYDAFTAAADQLAISFLDRGQVTPITSVYPSETTAAMTTFYTGRLPIEHGLLGWFQYLDGIGRDVVPLPFRTVDGTPLDELADPVSAETLFAGEALSKRARTSGIDVHAVQPAGISDSAFNGVAFDGADTHGYEDAGDMPATLRTVLKAVDGPALVHGYDPTIDAIAHTEGTDSDAYRERVVTAFEELRRDLVDRLDPAVAERTLLVVTADHGLIDTGPERNVDLRTTDIWPAFEACLRRDAEGEPRLPTGSPRNTHFHVRPEKLEEARRALESLVDGLVLTRREAVERGLFGAVSTDGAFPEEFPQPFARRCGDLVAVDRTRSLCWNDDDLTHEGMHGGLSRAEMLVPFAVSRLDALQ